MSAPRRAPLPPLLTRFCAGVVALTLLSFAYTCVMILTHQKSHPWGVQLLWGADYGWDLNVFRDRFVHFREPGFWEVPGIPLTYPAPVGVVLGVLYKLAHPLLDYLLLCTLGVVAWIAWLVRGFASRGIATGTAALFAITFAVTCWPLWVQFNIANIEGLVAMMLGAGLIAHAHRRWWLAAALIGIAGAMKIFPLVLLGLLLSKRRYREFCGGFAVAMAATIVSLAIVGPSIGEAQRQIGVGMRVVTTDDALAATSPGPDTNHSLYTVVRRAVLLAHHKHPHAPDLDPIAIAAILRPVYTGYLIVGALAGTAVYVFSIRRLPMLNQMLALTACAVMLPPLSRDYTLLHLLVPLGLLCFHAIEQAQASKAAPGLGACFACLVVIFTPGTFFNGAYSLGSPIRAMALLALFAIALRHPFHASCLDEPHEPAVV